MDDLHHAGADSVPVHVGPGAGSRIQADAGRQNRGHVRRVWPRDGPVQLDTRHRLPIGEHAVCRRHEQLARAEADPPPGEREAKYGRESVAAAIRLTTFNAEPGVLRRGDLRLGSATTKARRHDGATKKERSFLRQAVG